jgi:protein O-GlcNAc transferase
MGTALALSFADNAALQRAKLERAMAALQAGNFRDAERLFKDVLRTAPKHVAALNLLGVVLTQSGKFAEAETYLQRALREYPKSDATLYNYGLVLKALNRPAEALDRFSQALRLNPKAAETWNNRGTVFNDLARYDEAIADFDKAIALEPRYAEACCNKGKSLNALGRPAEALAVFERAVALRPDFAEGFAGAGYSNFQIQRFPEALGCFERALTLKADLVEAWLGKGNACREIGRLDEALAAFDRALAHRPDFADAWLGKGHACARLGKFDDAFDCYDRALSLRPDLAYAWIGRGHILGKLERFDDALAAYDQAETIKPDAPDLWHGRAHAFNRLQRYKDALAAADRALVLKPDFAEAWVERGDALCGLDQLEEGLAAYDKATFVNPNLAEAWLGCAKISNHFLQHKQAYAASDQALNLKGDIEYAESIRLHTKLYLCDWTDFAAEEARLLSAIRDADRACFPLPVLSIGSSPVDQLRSARRYIRTNAPAFPPLTNGRIYGHDRIRVAYISSDLHEHAVGYLTVGLFEHHDKSRFEVTAICLRSGRDSAFRRRLRAAFDRIVDIGSESDQDIAALIRALEIDVLVDLNGLTRNYRLGVFARRPAPVQVTYLGFAGTLGADFFDYIIADATVIPREHFGYYSENVVWLPDTFFVNDSARPVAERTPPRGELGLPEDGFVFCCFNQPYKVNPRIFDVWMRLLGAVEGGVLWLKDNGAESTENLRREAQQRGIAPERLVFAPQARRIEDHLARQRQADLFLDTLPYNAHTTAADALWVGVPVLTCLGSTFAGRVAASLVRAVGLPELVTESLADYEALALKLAHEPELLASLKARLAQNRATFPLFDTARFTRNIEAAYHTMCERSARGEPPAHFAVTVKHEYS